MKIISWKIFNSIEKNRLKLIEWKRKWYNYIISIQELVWSRNFKDGFIIDIYDLEENFLERVNIEIKSVCEFWYIHNKMFLKN